MSNTPMADERGVRWVYWPGCVGGAWGNEVGVNVTEIV